jgi:hypothetical protein
MGEGTRRADARMEKEVEGGWEGEEAQGGRRDDRYWRLGWLMRVLLTNRCGLALVITTFEILQVILRLNALASCSILDVIFGHLHGDGWAKELARIATDAHNKCPVKL